MTPSSAGSDGRFTSARRRAIARACSFGARTMADVARELAQDTDSIKTTFRSLVREGVLEEASAPHASGRAYELANRYRSELLAAIGSDVPRGQLLPGARMLIVGGRDAPAFARLALTLAATPVVMWTARTDGPARMLVATRAETTEEKTQVDQLEASISAEGLECVHLHVDRVLEPGELTSYARALARKPRLPELPSESASA